MTRSLASLLLCATAAIAPAAAERRTTMLLFETERCAGCDELDAVLEQPDVARQLARLELVRVDALSPESAALVESHAVVRHPTLVFLAPDGREIDRREGPFGFVALVGILMDAARGKDALADAMAAAERSPDDPELLMRAMVAADRRGRPELALAILGRIARTDPGNEMGLLEWAHHLAATVLADRGLPEQAIRILDALAATRVPLEDEAWLEHHAVQILAKAKDPRAAPRFRKLLARTDPSELEWTATFLLAARLGLPEVTVVARALVTTNPRRGLPMLARALAASGDDAGAEVAARAASRILPEEQAMPLLEEIASARAPAASAGTTSFLVARE